MTIFRTVTGDLSTVLGGDLRSAMLFVRSNVRAPQALVDLDNNKVYPPAADRIPLGGGMTFSISLIDTGGAGTNVPDGTLRWTIDLIGVDERGQPVKWSCENFALTADADLSDLVGTADPPATVANQYLTQMQALLDDMEEISGLTGEDAAVALLVDDEGSDTRLALNGLYERVVTSVSGESATATTARLNAALAAGSSFGVRKIVRLVGDFTHNGPLVIPSNTTLDATQATLTLAASSLTNGIINAAVTETRRVMDAVTTASSTTLTSATASFVAGDVGKTITIWNPAATGGKHTTTIAARTNSTTVTLTSAPSFTGTKQYASIGSRDRNITVKLGKVVRSASNFVSPANGWLSHHCRFRHVDNLDFDADDINIVSGKYAVNFGDCTAVRARRIYASATVSDVLHINGPCSGIRVDEVISDGSGDDIVSLTGGDFTTIHQIADCQGDITDVHVGTITTAPSTNVNNYTRAMLILAGQNDDGSIEYGCKRITVDRINSRLANAYPVYVGSDTQDHNTQGGYYEDISICANGGTNTTTGTLPQAFVALRHEQMSRVSVGPVRNVGGTYDLLIDTNAQITDLVTSGIRRSRIRVLATTPPASVKILGDLPYGDPLSDTTARETFDRRLVNVNDTVTITSGTVYFTYFRPDESATIASINTYTRGNAASGTTLARYGIYEVNSDDLTLIASSSSDTTMWNGTFASVGRALTANVTLSPFKVYALAVLFVGTTAPKIVGIESFSGSVAGGGSERLARHLAGQADLPASVGWASLATSEGKIIYSRMVLA